MGGWATGSRDWWRQQEEGMGGLVPAGGSDEDGLEESRRGGEARRGGRAARRVPAIDEVLAVSSTIIDGGRVHGYGWELEPGEEGRTRGAGARLEERRTEPALPAGQVPRRCC